MRIVGFNFEKIEAEKKSLGKGKLEISSNINIKSIEQEKAEIVKDKPVLKLSFEFKIEYKPNAADIKLNGIVLLLVEKDEAKDIIKKWKTKKIPEDLRLPIFNLILTKCNLRALQLEDELNLPAHLPMPKIKKEQQSNNANYTG